MRVECAETFVKNSEKFTILLERGKQLAKRVIVKKVLPREFVKLMKIQLANERKDISTEPLVGLYKST